MDKPVIALAIEALYWRMAYNDSNPEVGFGPFLDHVLMDIEKDIGFSFSKKERELILNRVERRRKGR